MTGNDVDMNPEAPILVALIIVVAVAVLIGLVVLAAIILFMERRNRGRMQVPPPYR